MYIFFKNDRYERLNKLNQVLKTTGQATVLWIFLNYMSSLDLVAEIYYIHIYVYMYVYVCI